MSNQPQQHQQQRPQDQKPAEWQPNRLTYFLIPDDRGPDQRCRQHIMSNFRGCLARIATEINMLTLTQDHSIVVFYEDAGDPENKGKVLMSKPVMLDKFVDEDGEGQPTLRWQNLTTEDGKQVNGLVATVVSACCGTTWDGKKRAVVCARLSDNGRKHLLSITGLS